MSTIMVIEDDPGIRSLLRMTLEMEHYQVLEAEDGEQGVKAVSQLAEAGKLPDLLLLDIMLPKLNGYQVLEATRDYDLPVIFLSAKDQVTDKVFGLKLGADDYITKPFEPMELLARVEAAIRSSRKRQPARSELKYADISLLTAEREVRKKGQRVLLTAKEYDLLLFLVRHVNQVFSREQLLEQVWGYDYLGSTRTVDVHIAQLRQKLDLQQEIVTVYKVGYKLVQAESK